MSLQQITAVVVNSDYVTNDLRRAELELLAERRVEYVSRNQAESMASRTGLPQWSMLAKAPPIFVVMDGIRYRGRQTETPISFPMRVTETSMPVCRTC